MTLNVEVEDISALDLKSNEYVLVYEDKVNPDIRHTVYVKELRGDTIQCHNSHGQVG